MVSKYVFLITSSNPVQKSVIEGVLNNSGLPYEIVDRALAPTPIIGALGPGGWSEFRVPEDRLQEAKDALCADGVVCEVSERLMRRCLDEIVRPLLSTRDRDLGRLAYFAEINNKETGRALFDATVMEAGGPELLEEFFFFLAREASPALKLVARALHGHESDAFAERFQSEITDGEKALRLSLIDVLPEFVARAWRWQALPPALLDSDAEVREAASEALFALASEDCGYDPEASLAERQAAVERMFKVAKLLDG